MRKVLIAACLLGLMPVGLIAADKIGVVATIRPLALIAEDIGGERIDVRQLIPSNHSPHDYALRMSDRKAIAEARLILWVGSLFEPFVEDLVSVDQVALAADQLKGIVWPSPSGKDHHGGSDPHLWLNPDNAVIIARRLAEQFAEVDPGNRSAYASNYELFRSDIVALDQAIEKRLQGFQGKKFVVLHDAYSHFVSRYRLSQMGSLRSSSGAQAGARTLTTLLERAQKESHFACVLGDPQFDNVAAQLFASRVGVRVIELDPLATDISSGSSGYKRFLQEFASKLEECFTTPDQQVARFPVGEDRYGFRVRASRFAINPSNEIR